MIIPIIFFAGAIVGGLAGYFLFRLITKFVVITEDSVYFILAALITIFAVVVAGAFISLAVLLL